MELAEKMNCDLGIPARIFNVRIKKELITTMAADALLNNETYD
ncbi:hypothetical protein CDFC105_03875 [Clostridioides difficile]|nr:hypothetical protein BN3456_02341 [Clostridium sp. C105KSO13]CZR75325.1 hypothetical protein CDFC105_03875 [Clostridioides difficile]